MAGAGELNDSDYSCGPRPRHVRPTLSKPASRYTSRPGHNVSSILDELRRRTRIFLGCTRRKTSDRQLHTYDVRGQVSPRFILCGTFSAWRRDTDSSSLQKPVLSSWLSCCYDGLAFAMLPWRLPIRSFCLSQAGPLKYWIACQGRDLLDFFLMFYLVTLWG